MSSPTRQDHDPVLFGASEEEGLVCVEHVARRGKDDEVVLFWRREERTVEEREPFRPFVVAEKSVLEGCPGEGETRRLEGSGGLTAAVTFPSWKQCLDAKTWLRKTTGLNPGSPDAPYLFLNDPVQQYLMSTGRTLFKGLEFHGLRRMQVDIECLASGGFEFCNAERPGDRIIAIAMGDNTGWTEVLSGANMDEKQLIERFVETVRERDPDVIEGHNIFNFDLPYITERARRHKVALGLGRDGSRPRTRASRFTVAERNIAYTRSDIFGRHVVDTLFLVHAYDVTHRSLDSLGLKQVARHFGLAARDRTYIEGSDIASEYERSPETVMKYARDDIIETRGVADLLSRSSFYQARMLPYSYQNACVKGTATRIDSLMVREYLRQNHALPLPDKARQFAGGYTDIFVQGVVENVHHADIRSLYPSLMLTKKLAPRSDELGVFLSMLDALRHFRLQAKERMAAAKSAADRNHYDALQSTFKVLINSFYGYLGFGQARFSDFSAAEKITAQGRKLLASMIDWLRKNEATPIEIDTDGIYFIPPRACLEGGAKSAGKKLAQFREDFAASLPKGVEIEFDGEYRSMYSYKMKNYALLDFDGEMVIKGAALKSRGLEPFQRDFMRDLIRLKLEGNAGEAPALKGRYEKALKGHEWPAEKLAKTERLQDSPQAYADAVESRGRPRKAAYELALRSERDYRAGDQVSYYVTGEKKSVTVYLSSKLASEWNPEKRDENVPYYLAKLDALYKKFGGEDAQQELGI